MVHSDSRPIRSGDEPKQGLLKPRQLRLQGGERLRDVGTRARAEIEELLGSKVFLDLHVKVAKDWQRDPKALQRLGF